MINSNDQNELRRVGFHITGDMGDCSYLISPEGFIDDVNLHCKAILGVEKEELIGKTVDDMWEMGIFENKENFFFGYDERPVPELLRQLNETEIQDTMIEVAPRLSHLAREKKMTVCGITRIALTKKVALFVSMPIYDKEGQLVRIFTTVRDLTEVIEFKNKIQEIETNLNFLVKRQFNEKFVGDSPSMRNIKYLISQTAASDATVLIYGETGTGKEVVARELLEKSHRKEKPYICINCAAIPETLFESELFGYEKGAFTGALNKRKIGLLEMANGGTVFLDEIEELPLSMQAKMLRVIQEREMRRIGGVESVKIDVRIISSTNRNLKEMIENGKFREDLYYRLNVISIKVPPLRARAEDILPLAYTFLKKYNEKYKKNKIFELEAATRLEYHAWPGNVRDLEHTIERLVIIGERGLITEEEVALALNDESRFETIRVESLQEAVDKAEKRAIENAFKVHKSSRRVAVVLGVSQPTILRKVKSLGININDD